MNNSKLVKILGLVATVGGVAMTLLTDWVNAPSRSSMVVRLRFRLPTLL